MAIHEGFQGLGNPEVVSGLEAFGVKFEFKDFNAGVKQLNLESGQFDDLKKFLAVFNQFLQKVIFGLDNDQSHIPEFD